MSAQDYYLRRERPAARTVPIDSGGEEGTESEDEAERQHGVREHRRVRDQGCAASAGSARAATPVALRDGLGEALGSTVSGVGELVGAGVAAARR